MKEKADKTRGTRSGPAPMDPNKTYINPGLEDQMEIIGYEPSVVRKMVCFTFMVLTLGFLWLVFYWRPDWMLKCTHTKCSLRIATAVLLQNQYKQAFVEKVIISSQDGIRVDLENAPSHEFCYVDQTDMIQNSRCDSDEEKIQHKQDQMNDNSFMKYFVNKKLKYIWNPANESFEVIRGLEEKMPCSSFHQCKGLSEKEQARRRTFYGNNAIPVHVTPILKLLFTEILNPFYIFQIFSMTLWYFDEYYYYASCIVFISTISIIMTVYQVRKMQRALKNTISASSIVTVCRGGEEYHDLPSDLVVPGDILEIPRHGCIMQCDAVLISGNCIVNESMLTGESVPVTKTPITNPQTSAGHEDKMFNMKSHSQHVLFCGTRVIQTRYYGNQKVRAVVIRTGFSTAKGELVRSILFPKPMDFKFTQDAYKFIGVLAVIAASGMIFTLVLMVRRGNEAGDIIKRTLDLITIVIPPALPAAMTVGIVFAQNRLKHGKIYCISPSGINVCGSINVVCFDKTGTLTEDGLDMWGVIPVEENRFQHVVHQASTLPENAPLKAAMATGHSLTIIEGVLSGDPLDLKMFEATGWELDEPGEDTSKFDVFSPTVVRPSIPDVARAASCDGINKIPFEIGIVKQFTFSSSLQRMSVITRTLGASQFDVYAKGSPEMIASLCLPDTVPVNFHDELLHYTQQGFRVIALAGKALPSKYNLVKVQRISREQIECDLTFYGLLIMENRLKPETTPVIQQLKNANLRIVMITGDNMLTALSVAHDCKIIDSNDKTILVHVVPQIGKQPPRIEWTYADDQSKEVEEIKSDSLKSTAVQIEGLNEHYHFAITGKSWALIREHFPELVSKIAVRGTVFARMGPEQKIQVVESLQELGYYVGMCGDGANDCGALKTAHAGISLSEAEASVASPFTSQEPNITCVPTVCKEGRAALVTSFGIFKYMALYSLTQFTSVTLLYWIGANLTDFQFLYIDLALLTTLSITYGRTGAYPVLVREAPPVSLISVMPILSIIVQALIMLTAQIFTWLYVREQPWVDPFVPNEDYDYVSDENTGVFYVSAFQYIVLAVILSKSAPYRKTIFSNYWFLGNLLIAFAVTVWIVVYPPEFLVELIELKPPISIPFRLIYLGIGAIYFFLSFISECFILDSPIVRRWFQMCFSGTKHDYMTIEEQIVASPSWPPVSQSTQSLADLMRLESVTSDVTSVEQVKLKTDSFEGDAVHKSNQKNNGDANGNSSSDSGVLSDDLQPPSYATSSANLFTGLPDANNSVDLNVPVSSTQTAPQLTEGGTGMIRSISYDTCPLVDNEVQGGNNTPVTQSTITTEL